MDLRFIGKISVPFSLYKDDPGWCQALCPDDTDLDHQGEEGWLRPFEVVDPSPVGNEAVGSNHGQEVFDDTFDRLKPTGPVYA